MFELYINITVVAQGAHAVPRVYICYTAPMFPFVRTPVLLLAVVPIDSTRQKVSEYKCVGRSHSYASVHRNVFTCCAYIALLLHITTSTERMLNLYFLYLDLISKLRLFFLTT